MGVTVPVIQVVGYQNSGKTTLIEKLLSKCRAAGLNVGVIKHHGHGGKPLLNDEHKDTGKHRKAGAAVTSIEGGGVFQLTMDSALLSLEKMVEIYQQLSLNSVIIEGFKNEQYPKVVLIRHKEDMELLKKCKNVRVIISWLSKEIPDTGIQTFHVSDEQQYIPWIINKLMRGVL